MKTIKELNVKVTYYVGLGNVEVSDEVYEALQYLVDCGEIGCDRVDLDEQIGTAFEWLEDNIQESDAYNWEYEIEEMEEE